VGKLEKAEEKKLAKEGLNQQMRSLPKFGQLSFQNCNLPVGVKHGNLAEVQKWAFRKPVSIIEAGMSDGTKKVDKTVFAAGNRLSLFSAMLSFGLIRGSGLGLASGTI